MKYILPLLSLLLLLTFSCGKTPTGDDLDGKWHLIARHTKATAEATSYAEAVPSPDYNIYWSFQLQLMSITTDGVVHNGHSDETVARFSHEGDRLTLTQCYIHYRDRDSLLLDPTTEELATVGIHGCTGQFRIATLSGRTLILCSDRDSLTFRKID